MTRGISRAAVDAASSLGPATLPAQTHSAAQASVRKTRFYAASPTFRKFHTDDTRIRAVMGSVGSGKSVGMCMEILARAKTQAPFEGVRASRWAVIRSSYRELKTTTIPTFRTWLGHLGTFTWDSPITFRTNKISLPDGSKLDLEVLFFPVASSEDVESLKSLELSGAWINEATGVPQACLQVLKTRLGRYPSDANGGPSWSGIIMDTNPPDTRHWFHDLFEVRRPKGHKLYRQPPPLLRNEDNTYSPNPHAENVENLKEGYDYYYNQIAGASDEFVRVYVMGEYGSIHDGKPVFDKFSDRKHVAEDDIQPNWNNPLIIGMDFGLTPAAAITQQSASGQLIVLDEITTKDTGFNEFLDDLLIPLLHANYRGHSVYIIGDPAGEGRSSLDKNTNYTMIQQRGIACDAAFTNSPSTRIDAVNYFLSRSDALLVNRKCTALIDGFSGGYKFEHARANEFKPRPAKNHSSHIMDALQYACLYYYRSVIDVPQKSVTNPRRQRAAPSRPPRKFLYA